MPATITEARDQMLGLLKAVVDAQTGNDNFDNFEFIWDDVPKQTPKDGDPVYPWARVKVIHTTGRQTALTDPNRRKKFTRGGFLIIQLFTPGSTGLVSHDDMVSIILGAYEGKTTSGGVAFRNCRFQEIGQDGPWHQTNLFVDFEYDDIRS